MSVLCCLTCHLLCGLTKYTVVGTALSPVSTLGMLAVSPGVPQALFSQGHQHRSTEVRSQDCNSHAPGPTVGAMETAQTLAWPSPCVHVSMKPTAAKASPVPAAGALVHSDVLQTLNLQSRWWRCKSAAHAAKGRDFIPASQVAQSLGLSCGFSLTSVSGQPTSGWGAGTPEAVIGACFPEPA